MDDDYAWTWRLVQDYFAHDDGVHLVKHLIDSYNDFVLNKVEQIVEGFNPIDIPSQYLPEHRAFKHIMSLEVKNLVLAKPTITERDGAVKVMTPYDARTRGLTYAGALVGDLLVTCKTFDEQARAHTTETRRFNRVTLGRLPIMVRSRYCVLSMLNPAQRRPHECPHDLGGYFIVNGTEKVVISQNRIAENKTFVFTNTKVTTYSHVAEVRSVQDGRFSVPKTTTIKLSARPSVHGHFMRACIHHIKHDIPLFVLFRALGVETDRAIARVVCQADPASDPAAELLREHLVGSMEDGSCATTCDAARDYLLRYMNVSGHPRELMADPAYRRTVLMGVLEREMLPHVGPSLGAKALYLGAMVRKLLLCWQGVQPFDDRDSYVNKRVDTPGVLLGNLMRQYYGKAIKDMRNMILKDMNTGPWRATNRLINLLSRSNVSKVVKANIIEAGLKYGLSTGNWGMKTSKAKMGVAQVLNRMTYSATLSHLRRINTPIEKSGKLVLPRKLHATQWGIVCPCECFDPATPILMWDGTIKEARDIVVGDQLIDDCGNPVRVRSTCSGTKAMYEVAPVKKNFMSHTVTDNHILTLKVKAYKRIPVHKQDGGMRRVMWFDKEQLRYRARYFYDEDERQAFYASLDDDDVIDITIEKYLSLPERVQKNLYIFKSTGINWPRQDVELDPYILGMWLGDGDSAGYGFTTADPELLEKWKEWGVEHDATITHGGRYHYGISSKINRAPLKKLLAKYRLVKNKHIPREYLINDRQTRLAVLAGLIDTDGNVRADGHEIRICQGEKNYRLLYDAEFLARSLGFSCHVNDGICSYTVKGEKRQKPYKELRITGPQAYEIPTVLPRKKISKYADPTMETRCYNRSAFKLVSKDVQPFVGWQLEGNGRFLLGDMSLSHNTPEVFGRRGWVTQNASRWPSRNTRPPPT